MFERLAAHADAGDVVRLFRSDRGDGLAAAMWVLCWNGHWVFWRFGAVERPVLRLTHFPLATRVRGRLRRALRPRA